MAMTVIPETFLGISSQLLREAKRIVAPVFFAEMSFSAIPPIAPTLPSAEMVPDPAIFLP
ncbi:unannotated protein [freshwater metagenome]|uniref:Unannotated protein n=1 Tax=freshwater metagenome TaxID=449393 RepID=A0A6J6AEM1_9ZZZZ